MYSTTDWKLLLNDDERKNLEDLNKLLEPFERATRKCPQKNSLQAV
jgi:hypothetical protein